LTDDLVTGDRTESSSLARAKADPDTGAKRMLVATQSPLLPKVLYTPVVEHKPRWFGCENEQCIGYLGRAGF